MLQSILFGFLLSGRRHHHQQDPDPDPEQGGTNEKREAETSSPSSTNQNSENSSGSNGDEGIERDGSDENELDEAVGNASVDENDIIRQVDGEGRNRSRDEEETQTNETPTSKIPIHRKMKMAIQRTFTSDKSEDIVPTYRSLPIFSGVLIPFSILLEIPGLTDNWYIRTENHEVVEIKPNPHILDVGLGFSIACALIANVCLIVRFLEKNVKSMTWTCTAFLTVHDVINITIVTVFGISHRFDDGFTYGQAFWMTVCSTIASTLTNITLLIDLFRTPNFARSGSGLTRKQRSLVIIIILLLCYLAFGALINHVLMDLTFINALYFTVVSIETIGFGDITPETTGSRVFICFYAVFGILNLGLAVSMTRDTVLESLEVSSRIRVQRLRKRRLAAQWRHHVVHHWRDGVAWRLRAKDLPLWVPDEEGVRRPQWTSFIDRLHWPWLKRKWMLLTGNYPWLKKETLDCGLGYIAFDGQHRGMHLNLDGLTKHEIRAAAMETGVDLDILLPKDYWMKRFGNEINGYADVPAAPGRGYNHAPLDTPMTHTIMGRMVRMVGYIAFAVDNSLMDPERQKRLPTLQSTQVLSMPRFSDQYSDFRERMEKEEKNALYIRFGYSWMLFVIFWLVGSAIFMKTEKWTFGIAMYFCFISFTTIGYGEFSPTTPAGRSVFIVWALLGVGTVTILISILSDGYSKRYKHIIRAGVFDHVIKRYRTQVRQRASAVDRQVSPPIRPYAVTTEKAAKLSYSTTATMTPRGAQTDGEQEPTRKKHLSEELEEVGRRTRDILAELPREVLQQARQFHDDIHYFINPAHSVTPTLDQKLSAREDLEARGSGATQGVGDATTSEGAEGETEERRRPGRLMSKLTSKKSREGKIQHRDDVLRGRQTAKPIPDSLDRLLKDITGVQGLSQQTKEEILDDDDARHALLALSIEQALKRLILSAEDALHALEEEDALVRLHEQELLHEADLIEDEREQGESSTSARAGTSGS